MPAMIDFSGRGKRIQIYKRAHDQAGPELESRPQTGW
jgi:hypothetical protein